MFFIRTPKNLDFGAGTLYWIGVAWAVYARCFPCTSTHRGRASAARYQTRHLATLHSIYRIATRFGPRGAQRPPSS